MDVFPGGTDVLGVLPQSRLRPDNEEMHPSARLANLSAEVHQLRAELDQLRAQRNELLDTQRRMMELMGVTDPGKIVHDLRNVLNERDLLKALCEEQL